MSLSQPWSHTLNLVASAGPDFTVRLWDFQFAKLEHVCVGHKEEVTALAFVDPYPVLLSADCGGNIFFWAVRPSTALTSTSCGSSDDFTSNAQPFAAGSAAARE